jgi:hypothetical protein
MQYIERNFNVENGKCKYFNCLEELKDISKPIHISRKVSEICERYYGKTPIINNEMINKTNLSSQIVKARGKIVQFIFEELDKENRIELTGSGPEVTIYRATIKNKGLDVNRRSLDDECLNQVLDVIEQFIRLSEGNKNSFADLYKNLCSNGYALRLGIIPIYLAFIMREFRNGLVIYAGDKEVPLTVETLNSINNNPKQYSLILDEGTNEKEEYIKNIELLFDGYGKTRNIGYNRFSNLIISMQNWMQSLPKYSREYEMRYTIGGDEKVAKDIIGLRKDLLKFEINPREFLLERLRKKIIREDSFEKCINRLTVIKSELDNHLKNLVNVLINRTKDLFEENYSGEVSTLMQHWYRNLSESGKKHAYDSVTNELLRYIARLSTHNDEAVIQSMSHIITGLNIEDWNDNMFSRYINEVERFISVVSSYKDEDEIVIDSTEEYQLTFFIEGNKVEKVFEAQQISPLGVTLLDDIEQSLEEYGDSININEKRNILMELIKRFM